MMSRYSLSSRGDFDEVLKNRKLQLLNTKLFILYNEKFQNDRALKKTPTRLKMLYRSGDLSGDFIYLNT